MEKCRKTELELSLAGLDFHRPTSPASSLTDDEELPPHIIRIKNDSESDGERQPLPLCLTQTSPRGSQPTPSPPPRMEEQQEYIETEEPKREPEVAPTYPASPTTQTPPQDLQAYLMSLERDRLSTSNTTMGLVIALPETRRALEQAVAGGTVAEFDSQVSLLLRSCRLLGRAVCREIMLNTFHDH